MEDITYSNLWSGDADTMRKDGAQVGDILTATFVVASHEIEIDDGTDGAGHGIAVEVTSVANPQSAYSFAKNGPYVDTLLLMNACETTAIWHTVTASGYNTYTNWATVTITPPPVTLVSDGVEKVYGGTRLPLPHLDEGWYCFKSL